MKSMLRLAVAAAPVVFLSQASAQGGPVVGWGENSVGQASPPPGNFIAVAGHNQFSVGIREDGTLAQWGNITPALGPAPPGHYTAVAAGTSSGAAIATNGAVVSWGSLLGKTPSGQFMDVAVGIGHAVAIRTDGTLASWGQNAWPVPAGEFRLVDAFEGDLLGIRADGTLVHWGRGGSSIVNVPSGRFVDAAIGAGFGVAIREDTRTLEVWGVNQHVLANIPTGTFLSVAAGWNFAVGLRTDGTLAAWGSNEFGELNVPSGHYAQVEAGIVHGLAIVPAPGAGSLLPAILIWLRRRRRALAASAALGIPGELCAAQPSVVASWGSDKYGEISLIPPAEVFAQISAGTHFTLALRPNGTIAHFGFEGEPQATQHPWTLVPVPDPGPGAAFHVIEAGHQFAIALRNDGRLFAWGRNESNQTVLPAGENNYIAISAGEYHGLAMRPSGQLVHWGSTDYHLSDPAFMPRDPVSFPEERVIAFSAGAYHNAVILRGPDSSGREFYIKVWGTYDNANSAHMETITQDPRPQWNPNLSTEQFKAVSAGHRHTLAITMDGHLRVWGNNHCNQVALPPEVNPQDTFESVSAGYAHSIAVRAGGPLYAWGGTCAPFLQWAVGAEPQQPPALISPAQGDSAAHGVAFIVRTGVNCYANCDGSTTPPYLNVNDFICFNNWLAAGDLRANCDLSTVIPVLNVNDSICFQQKFSAGCP